MATKTSPPSAANCTRYRLDHPFRTKGVPMKSEAPTEPDRAAERGATRVRYRVLAIGCSFALLAYIQRQSFVRGTTALGEALRLDELHMGCLVAAFLVAY